MSHGSADDFDHVGDVVAGVGLRILGEPLGGKMVGGEAGFGGAVDGQVEFHEQVREGAEGGDAIFEGHAQVHVEDSKIRVGDAKGHDVVLPCKSKRVCGGKCTGG